MNDPAPYPTHTTLPSKSTRPPARFVRALLGALAIFGLIGCGTLQGLGAPEQPSVETQIAAQVTLLAATAMQALPAAPQPVQEAQPTYTPLPTYTPFPTFTAYPTYTLVPTFTWPAPALMETSIYPTQTPLSYPGAGHPYILRVRNMFRSTYWIGTYLPYGGNFIKPLWYVEFYPPEPMEMRIFFCRYTDYFRNHWQDIDYEYVYDDLDTTNNWDGCRRWDYFNYWWDRGALYNCNYHDYYVDEPLMEVGVP